ncbi:MAG: type II toxin-antitoxin system VapC family toxin [Methylovulum sp.]|nr:type II toxin-antitoxin system VapC family toxin [Methylovulum sp.]
MIGIDTNILARFYVDDPNDPEAVKQRPIARRIMTESQQLFVPLTVILELEWVLRAFYRFDTEDFRLVIDHLLGLANVTVEEWPRVTQALALQAEGLDFADALHLTACSQCEHFFSFDDRRFARRAARLPVTPPVTVPT